MKYSKHLEELTRELKRQNDILEAMAESVFHANNHISDISYIELLKKRSLAVAKGEIDNVGDIIARQVQAERVHDANIKEKVRARRQEPKLGDAGSVLQESE